MRLLLTGGRGFIGSALTDLLGTRRVDIRHLSRSATVDGVEAATWNPGKGQISSEALENLDAVVHLAGESIASGRWTTSRKARIRDSRVQGTALLAQTLANCQNPPRTLVCASAIGFYGDCGDEIVDEDSPQGDGFLAQVTADWESAAQSARDAGIRVVHLRFGLVLSPSGGALAAMLAPFRLGLGGPIGSGRQYLSWVTLNDVVRAIDHVLVDEQIQGPLNVVSPNPVRQRTFARILGKILRRPAILPLPGWVVRLLLGEMGRELLLASTRVEPKVLSASDYSFEQSDLETALEDLLTA